MYFLVADTQLYKRLCPSVGPFVGLSIGVWTLVEKWEKEHFRCFLCRGVDGGWTLLPLRPQQYCDPASLVVYFHIKQICATDVQILVEMQDP